MTGAATSRRKQRGAAQTPGGLRRRGTEVSTAENVPSPSSPPRAPRGLLQPYVELQRVADDVTRHGLRQYVS